MKLGKKNISRKDIVRTEGEQVVFGNKVAMDKERVAEVVIVGGTIAALGVMTAHECNRNGSEDGVLANTAAVGTAMMVGAVAFAGIACCEGMRMQRLENESSQPIMSDLVSIVNNDSLDTPVDADLDNGISLD